MIKRPRNCQFCRTAHLQDFSATFTGHVTHGLPEKEGETRAGVYFPKGARPNQLFAQETIASSPDLTANSPDLSLALERDSKALQDQYLTSMVAEEKLRLKFPETKNHPAQAYRTKS